MVISEVLLLQEDFYFYSLVYLCNHSEVVENLYHQDVQNLYQILYYQFLDSMDDDPASFLHHDVLQI
jgi:hypothetical protein